MTSTIAPKDAALPVPLPIYPDLASKVALVTAGSGDIGSATCRLLAANGTRLIVNARDQGRSMRRSTPSGRGAARRSA